MKFHLNLNLDIILNDLVLNFICFHLDENSSILFKINLMHLINGFERIENLLRNFNLQLTNSQLSLGNY